MTWRVHNDHPVHVWPDWQKDREHVLVNDICWCGPKVELVDKKIGGFGVVYHHRPTWRQRLHLLPGEIRGRIRRRRRR